MAEFKPKQDDHMANGVPSKELRPSKETKPHGDKLQKALDAVQNALDEMPKQRTPAKPH